jgi:hypothetical protein
VVATEVQLMNGFILQGKSTVGFLIISIASMDNMKEAQRPMIEKIIKM